MNIFGRIKAALGGLLGIDPGRLTQAAPLAEKPVEDATDAPSVIDDTDADDRLQRENDVIVKALGDSEYPVDWCHNLRPVSRAFRVGPQLSQALLNEPVDTSDSDFWIPPFRIFEIILGPFPDRMNNKTLHCTIISAAQKLPIEISGVFPDGEPCNRGELWFILVSVGDPENKRECEHGRALAVKLCVARVAPQPFQYGVIGASQFVGREPCPEEARSETVAQKATRRYFPAIINFIRILNHRAVEIQPAIDPEQPNRAHRRRSQYVKRDHYDIVLRPQYSVKRCLGDLSSGRMRRFVHPRRHAVMQHVRVLKTGKWVLVRSHLRGGKMATGQPNYDAEKLESLLTGAGK